MSQANHASTTDSAYSATPHIFEDYIADDGPTAAEMDDMWLSLREAEEAEDRANFERMRRAVNAPILEKALEDEALYGEAA